METTTIKISGIEYKIKQSFRALLQFEEMTGKAVTTINDSIGDIIKLFFCILSANNRDKFNYTFDQFLDLIDDNPESIEVFNKFLSSTAQPEEKPSKKKNR